MTVGSRGRPGLLVSVRSADEARAALEGGADLIDVKEPSRGALGPADPQVIHEVIAGVDGRVPVSAALGEWRDWIPKPLPLGLRFVKWGLARLATTANASLMHVRRASPGPDPVLVAYADHDRAGSPEPEWLAERAVALHFPAFLFDTAVKDGTTLLDWVAPAALARIRFRLAEAGIAVALAGSLDESAIRRLAALSPDWFAVRGAVCEGGRGGTLSADRVRRLKQVIAEQPAVAAS